jgi:hypothetical protein
MAFKLSLRFAMMLLILHMVAALLVYVTAIAPEARMAMLLLILLSLLYYLARDVFLLLPDSWQEISLDQGEVVIVTRRGSKLIGRITNRTAVSPYFIVLCIKFEGFHLLHSRVIFPDALNVGAFREICVRLKYA